MYSREFTKLSDELTKSNFEFQKGDYLYFHKGDEYPLKTEMNFNNLFFIDEFSDCKVKVIGVLNGKEKEINFSDYSKDNWWLMQMPIQIRVLLNQK